MWRKGDPSALLVGMQTGEATVENSMESPQKIQKGALASVVQLVGALSFKPKGHRFNSWSEHMTRL